MSKKISEKIYKILLLAIVPALIIDLLMQTFCSRILLGAIFIALWVALTFYMRSVYFPTRPA